MDKRANQKADWSGVLTDTMLIYAAYDVLYLSLLWDKVKKRIKTKAYQLDICNLKYAIEYSRRGVMVDLDRVHKKLLTSTNKYEKSLTKLPINPNSPKQVNEWLGTTSSDKDTLEKLTLEGNTDAALVRKCRLLSKEVMFLKRYNRGIVKGFFNPCGAISGRFSCTGGDRFDHVNLQQWAKRLLPVIKAREGNVIVYSDYTGLELYMAVAWVGEPTMKKLILDGIDVHTYTASVIYKVKYEDVTKEQRFVGKTCNFLLIYGGWHTVLQSTLRAWGGLLISLEEARSIRQAWFKLYPGFVEWHSLNKKLVSIYGYLDVSTALGRTVRCVKVNDALSIPIQGSSSEVTKTALKFLKSRYNDEYLINTIHDSIALECQEGQAPLWVGRLDECMVDAWYEVTKDLEVPDLPMPKGATFNKHWEF
jgi:DNA polymerase-1